MSSSSSSSSTDNAATKMKNDAKNSSIASKMSSSSTSCAKKKNVLMYVGLTVVITPMLFLLLHMYQKHFYFQNLDSLNINRMKTNTTFVRRDVSITYYHRGELHKVLPKGGWLHDPNDDGLRVFRLYPDEDEFTIDINKVQTSLRVEEVIEDCTNQHGWLYCPGETCQKDGGQVVSGEAQDILTADSSLYYGSFALISKNVVDYLLTTLKLPFEFGRSFEQSFISNFKKQTITAQIHANPATHSVAVQYTGRKTWLFIGATNFLSHDGFYSTSINGPYVPLKAPTSDTMEYWIYKSKPGDLFYFPPFYAHVVLTHPGPNVMVTFRKPFLSEILYRPHSFFHGVFNYKFFSKPANDQVVKVTADGKEWDGQMSTTSKKGPKVVGGFTAIFNEYMNAFGQVGQGCSDQSDDNMDKKLAKLLLEASATIP